MRYLSWMITIPLTVLSVLFLVGNTGKVAVHYWINTPPFDVPLYAVGLAMLGIGFLAGAMFISLSYYALRHKHWRLKRRLARLEEEMDDLLNAPRTAEDDEEPPKKPHLMLIRHR